MHLLSCKYYTWLRLICGSLTNPEISVHPLLGKKEKKIWLAFRPSCTVYYCQKWKLHFLENFLDINAYYVIFNFHFCMCKIVYSFIFYVISFHFTLYQEESKLSIYIFLDIRVVIKVWDKGNIKVSSLWFQPPFLL